MSRDHKSLVLVLLREGSTDTRVVRMKKERWWVVVLHIQSVYYVLPMAEHRSHKAIPDHPRAGQELKSRHGRWYQLWQFSSTYIVVNNLVF